MCTKDAKSDYICCVYILYFLTLKFRQVKSASHIVALILATIRFKSFIYQAEPAVDLISLYRTNAIFLEDSKKCATGKDGVAIPVLPGDSKLASLIIFMEMEENRSKSRK